MNRQAVGYAVKQLQHLADEEVLEQLRGLYQVRLHGGGGGGGGCMRVSVPLKRNRRQAGRYYAPVSHPQTHHHNPKTQFNQTTGGEGRPGREGPR